MVSKNAGFDLCDGTQRRVSSFYVQSVACTLYLTIVDKPSYFQTRGCAELSTRFYLLVEKLNNLIEPVGTKTNIKGIGVHNASAKCRVRCQRLTPGPNTTQWAKLLIVSVLLGSREDAGKAAASSCCYLCSVSQQTLSLPRPFKRWRAMKSYWCCNEDNGT